MRKWRDYIDDAGAPGGPTKIAKDRRKKLTGRDFSASTITEILSIAGKLDERVRENLDMARRARNDFVHNLKPCEPHLAFLGAHVAAQLIAEEAGLDFRIGSGFSYQT